MRLLLALILIPHLAFAAWQTKWRRGSSASWSSANPVLSSGEPGVDTTLNRWKLGDGVTAWNSLGWAGATGDTQTRLYKNWGSGITGSATISSSDTLTDNRYYTNLKITSGAQLDLSGYQLWVNGTLDLTSCPTNGIYGAGGNGGNASGSTGGTAGCAGGTLNQNYACTAGAAGNTGGTGSSPSANSCTSGYIGGYGGVGGSGGAGSGGSAPGNNSGCAGITTSSVWLPYEWATNLVVRNVALIGGGSGGCGRAGAGDGGANTGGGGGGSGGGGPVMTIYARRIIRGPGTAAGCITNKGGDGGNGASPSAGNSGGGGGGGGGGAGATLVLFDELVGSAAVGAVRNVGGVGGLGAAGTGTGTAGNTGGNGNGGYIVLQALNGQTDFPVSWQYTSEIHSDGFYNTITTGTQPASQKAARVMEMTL